jgi:hypothetical protein
MRGLDEARAPEGVKAALKRDDAFVPCVSQNMLRFGAFIVVFCDDNDQALPLEELPCALGKLAERDVADMASARWLHLGVARLRTSTYW